MKWFLISHLHSLFVVVAAFGWTANSVTSSRTVLFRSMWKWGEREKAKFLLKQQNNTVTRKQLVKKVKHLPNTLYSTDLSRKKHLIFASSTAEYRYLSIFDRFVDVDFFHSYMNCLSTTISTCTYWSNAGHFNLVPISLYWADFTHQKHLIFAFSTAMWLYLSILYGCFDGFLITPALLQHFTRVCMGGHWK